MRHSTIFVLVPMLLMAGCVRTVNVGGTVAHTSFFNTHDARAYFEEIAEKEDLKTWGSGSGHSLGGPTGHKDFEVLMDGNETVRNRIMAAYRDQVRREIASAGGNIQGRSRWTTGSGTGLSGFRFNYTANDTRGFFWANAVVNQDGHIEINVLMYEHG